MRTPLTVLIAGCLTFLAALPWLASGLAERPLVPPELQEAPVRYEATADAIRSATREAGSKRRSTGGAAVVATIVHSTSPAEAGTPSPVEQDVVVSTATAVESPAPATTTGGTQPATGVAETHVEIDAPPAPASTSRAVVVTVSLAITPTLTMGAAEDASIASTGMPSQPATVIVEDGVSVVPTPAGMVDTEDVITAEMLADQVRRDAEGVTLSGLAITLTPDGVRAVGVSALLPGIAQRSEVSGVFAVERDSLVIKVTSIHFDRVDVTEQYRGKLESRLNSSLYQLLPQRYVQSFELAHGYIRVHSKVRP